MVRTHALLRLLSLWSYDYEVSFDMVRKQIVISKRTLWFLRKTRTIPFSQVRRIQNDYASMGTSWDYSLQRNAAVESFTVSLVLAKDEEIIPVARFRGRGSVMRGWTGVLMGDSLVDVEGNQQDASKLFAEELEQVLLLNPRAATKPLSSPPTHSCVECGQAAPYNREDCLYCGGLLETRHVSRGIKLAKTIKDPCQDRCLCLDKTDCVEGRIVKRRPQRAQFD
jgi:hypothetical protein